MKFHDRRLLASCALSGVGTLCVYEQTLKGSEKCADRDHGRMEALSSAVARTEKAVLLVFNEVVIKVEKGGGLWEQLEGVVIRSMQPDPAPPVATDTIQAGEEVLRCGPCALCCNPPWMSARPL